MSSDSRREAAYADLVSGMLDARHDAATARFDAALAAAEGDGLVDPATARMLRWWQRESVRAVVDHARLVLPPALSALDQAQHDSAEAAAAADRSYRMARRVGLADQPEAMAAPTDEDGPLVPPADLTARRRRMLVAGLTVLPDDS